MDDIPTYMKYWGKAKKSPDSDCADYHLLPFHSLDVAAVGYCLLESDSVLCTRLAQTLNVERGWLQQWFSFCLILHDLGKFFRAFQNLSPDMSESLVGSHNKCVYTKRHDTLGYAIWLDIVKRLNQQIPSKFTKRLEPWLQIVCGHHGKPPEYLKPYTSYLLEEDEIAAERFVSDVCVIWMPNLEPLLSIEVKTLRGCSWQFAGLAVLADWLGSNQSIFSYQAKPVKLVDYWSGKALPGALEALRESGLGQRAVNTFESIRQQFDFIVEPTPLQSYAENVGIGEGPQLFILEDVTGAGKTEAAMVLAHRLISLGRANGLYVGLPTMATANGMYKRMAQSYRKLYALDESPSLVLAHGASKLSKEFSDSVVLSSQSSDTNYQLGELTASAYCNHWLADSRKKALLADVGVGTIDQALLGILPAKHQSLRMFGLTDKVLIVDEVHAFDPYMQQLLCTLLTAHALQGGSVILLSATLPLSFRKMLTHAYAKGLDIGAPTLEVNAGYPWVTQLSVSHFSEIGVETRPSVERQVAVSRLSDEEAVLDVIERTVMAGHCVCWIRNTVKDAHSAYQLLEQSSIIDEQKLTLFHSRYAMADRQNIEQGVLDKFGKASGESKRTGQVLIATQVVEQSLDLDFDVMISDLAPIDLVIQRAGRLQRHTRSRSGNRQEHEERDKPHFFILAPDPEKVVSKNWLRELLPGTQAVYPNVGQLWLTLSMLVSENGFAMPQDARQLIEGVYGESADEKIPEVLLEATAQAIAESSSEASMGRFNVLKLDKGYCDKSAIHNAGWDDEVNIPTRLGGDSVTCVLVKKIEGQWQAYASGSEHAWALSQISLPKKEWEKVRRMIPAQLQKEMEGLREGVAALKWLELLPLVAEFEHCYSAGSGWKIRD